MDKPDNLNYLLYPRSVAVIGASSTPGRVGYTIINNLLQSHYPGRLYPINPNIQETLGIKAYPSITAVSDDIDLVMIAIQPKSVANIIDRCATKKVKVAIIHSAGFSEVGKEGKKLEGEVLKIARKNGIRVIGPNTQGIINTSANLMALSLNFPTVKSLSRGKGIAFICQTGYFYWDWVFRHPELGLVKAVDLGNMSDLSHTDFLQNFGDDPQTQLIALQIEEIRDGTRFLELSSHITESKPIIALKAGRTQSGTRAIASHTGSLAGNDTVYDTAFKQAGIIRAYDMDELVDFTKTLSYLSPLPSGNRVAIITFSGAAAALAADACEEHGMQVAQLSQSTTERIGKILPAWAAISNPIDLFQSPEVDQKMAHTLTIEALFADPNVDAIMIIALMTVLHEPFDIFDILMARIKQGLRKPIVISGVRDEQGSKRWSILEANGITTYSSIQRAMKSLAIAYSRYRYLNTKDKASNTY
ncbi:MAG: CoA-binding protein [Dehalococcoidia bacterium]|nr:CoA-binding protein [Dehalococcoidia bacterium]